MEIENFVGYKVIRSRGDAEKSNEFSSEPVYAEIPYTLTEEDIEVNARWANIQMLLRQIQ